MQLSAPRASGQVVADIDLDGGRLASLVVDGLSLLVERTDRPTRWGSFPMIPWCGRLPRGRLTYNGVAYRFPITSKPHANHGLTHTALWTQVDDNTITTELGEPWPFGGHVVQRFDLTSRSLTVTAEVHAGEVPMPAMIGWHPWFKRRLERGGNATLSVLAESAYELDAQMIPTGEFVQVPPQPWNDCLVDMLLPPVIDWPNALTLSISSTFDHWVVFTEPTHALCVEPQSGPPNQINSNPTIVEPGHPLVGSMTLDWG